MERFENWQIDTLSLLIGLVAGLAVAYVFSLLRPLVRRQSARLIGWGRERLAYLRSGVAARFVAETAVYANSHHLLTKMSDLDPLFVSPRLLAPLEDPALVPDDRAATALAYLWPEWAKGMALPLTPTMTVDQLLKNGRRVIIAAEPGMGKTTLLAHLAHRYATISAEGPDAPLRNILPVLVHVAELGLAGGGEMGAARGAQSRGWLGQRSWRHFLEAEIDVAESVLVRALQKRANHLTSPGIKDLIHEKLKAGQVLLLLDGWDALPAAKRPYVADWLEKLLRKYGQTQTFVASGLSGYGPLLELDFTWTTLLPWRLGEVEGFAEQARQTLSISQPPRLPYFWQPGQTTLSTVLNFALRSVGESGQYPKRPLSGAELIQASLTLFNGGEPPDEQVIAFWQRLAHIMMHQQKVALDAAEVSAMAESLALAGDQQIDRGLLNRLQNSLKNSSLFITWANGSLSFRGLAWRDFLAAGHLQAQGEAATISPYLNNYDWTRVLSFYVSQVNPSELVKQLLQRQDNTPSRESFFQAASWLRYSKEKGEWRRQVMILLGQMIRSESSFSSILRQRALAAMAQSDEAGVMTFVSKLLERSNPFLRQLGTTALARLGTDQAITLLAGMVADGDELVRQAAVYGLLLHQHHPLAEQALLSALIGNDEELRQIVAEGLAMNGPRGTEILEEALTDDDIHVRRAAVQGLSLLDEEWVEKRLIQVERHDEEWHVRAAANEALEAMRARRKVRPWEPPNPADQRWLTLAFRENGRVVPDGAAALPFLVQLISDSDDPKMRSSAANLLGYLPALDAIPALETAARDPDGQVREAAFTTLCRLRRAYE